MPRFRGAIASLNKTIYKFLMLIYKFIRIIKLILKLVVSPADAAFAERNLKR
jgi:hypothetical protein